MKTNFKGLDVSPNDDKRVLPTISLTLEQIENELNSEIDYMIQCVQDSSGTVDTGKDIHDIETAKRVIKSLFDSVEHRVRNGYYKLHI